jgi:transcriptional regulator with XRE-family HTH domain
LPTLTHEEPPPTMPAPIDGPLFSPATDGAGGRAAELGSLLRSRRRSRGETIERVATRLGIHPNSLRNIEQGKRAEGETLVKYGALVGLEPNEIAQRLGWWSPAADWTRLAPDLAEVLGALAALPEATRNQLLVVIRQMVRAASMDLLSRDR